MRTIPADLVKRYEAEGWWTRDTLGALLARGLQAAPETAFRVRSAVRPWSGTFRDVERVARRLAGGLRARGVGPGDLVAFQLPNWMEAAAVFWASAFLGAVVVPIVHFYGRKGVGHILDPIKPPVFVTARDPKGVIHSHQTLGFETRQLAERSPSDRGAQLTAAPVGHFIGMVSAFLIPVLDASPVNLADVWDPARVLALMRSDGLTVGGGAPYYLTSLLDHPDFTPRHMAHMKYAGLGGASVPAAGDRPRACPAVPLSRSPRPTPHPTPPAP